MILVGGLDLSKSHYAMVLKNEDTGKVKWYIGWPTPSAVKKWAKQFPDYVFDDMPKKEKFDSLEHFNMKQGIFLTKIIEKHLFDFIGGSLSNAIISLEGLVPYGSRTIDLAEVTRPVKEMMYKHGWSIRIHDPQSVKLWAGKGNYKKIDMVREARKYIDIPEAFCQSKNPDTWMAADIADAYFLRMMLEAEMAVRRDPGEMNRLNEHQLQVVNRITKSHPVNLLNREFLAKEQPELVRRKRLLRKEK